MDFALSDDQHAIQEAARVFLTDAANPDVIRAAVESAAGFDADLWRSLAGEMGFAGLMVPEQFGGLGLGAVEMALVLEETGRVLAPVPFFETAVLAVQAVLAELVDLVPT
ncbi:acyl-CoA dehydrogenase family protein, partial [Sphingobium sp.]|uniref:acyl-CoA dehydrogenase family protein n=1 Tax=Sphingobium sp. TaxID=1912891 RepID=UPI002CA168D9